MIVSKPFEDKVLACLYRSRDFAVIAAQHLKPSYFHDALQHNLAKLALDYAKRYSGVISAMAAVEGVKKLVEAKTIKPTELPAYGAELKRLQSVDIADEAYVLEKLVEFVWEKETRAFIEDAVKTMLPKGDRKGIEKRFTEIAQITAERDREPVDFFAEETIKARAERREAAFTATGSKAISTGIKRMDDVMPHKGFVPKELMVFMAPPKRGKSMALGWFANCAAWQGKNAALFSCEVSEEVMSDRMEAMNVGMEIKGLSSNIIEVRDKMLAKRPPGRLLIYEYPTKRLTAAEIERQLRKQERQGARIDMLVVDYADIMRPSRLMGDDYLREQASIFEDLRGIAGEWEIPVLTATQVNRQGSNKAVISGEDIAGTWDKVMVADYLISLSATEDELKKNEMKIHFAQCRNVPRTTLKITTKYNFGRFFEEFIDDVT